jgi:Tfp pilus assembly protein PilX
MIRRHQPRHLQRHQQGVSLLVVTLLMLALSLITVSSYFNSQTQFRLSGNNQASELAFSRAEAAVATAEAWLNATGNAQSAAFDSYSIKYLYPMGQFALSGYTATSMDWNDTNSLSTGNARYLVEQLGRNVRQPGDSLSVGQISTSCRAVNLFRVLARGDGTAGASRIIEITTAVSAC